MDRPRPAWADIDLGAVHANVAAVGARLNAGTKTMAVVKANAYGHGDVEVARAALEAGATWLGVILVDEGLRLRAAGIDAPILLLHEAPAERVREALDNDLTPCVFTEAGARVLADAARTPVRVHLKLDTGLNRLGSPPDQLEALVKALANAPQLQIEAVFTHFAFADRPAHAFIDTQLERFAEMCARLEGLGMSWGFRHVANSAAAITRPDTHFDMIRLGIAMYGLSPGPDCDGYVELRPAMSLTARAAMVKRVPAGEAVSYGHTYRLERDATIVSVPVGYADGWPRGLGNNAEVLVNGRRHPAVGTVCMDSFMVDIGDEECAVGDEVVLIGRQGDAEVTADELAERLGTINYEIVTRVGARVPRIHG